MAAGQTSLSSGLLDQWGNPIPAEITVDILSLPLIERAALPGLPRDFEARLFESTDPLIVVRHPRSGAWIEMSLLDMENVAEDAARVRAVGEKQSMGGPPDLRSP